jgi:hypothetical protein
MKKIVLTFIILPLVLTIAFGQGHDISNSKIYNSSRYLYILYFANGKFIQTNNLISRHDEVQEMISRVESIKRYGIITKVGAIILRAQSNYQLIFMNQILKSFNISDENKDLPVYIDDQYVEEPETIVAESDEITSVEVVSGKNGRYINIKTKEYAISKKIQSNIIPYSKYYLQNNEIADIDAFYLIQ